MARSLTRKTVPLALAALALLGGIAAWRWTRADRTKEMARVPAHAAAAPPRQHAAAAASGSAAPPPPAARASEAEQMALEIEALVQLGRIGRARSLADRFYRRFPDSPEIARIERLTGYHPRPYGP